MRLLLLELLAGAGDSNGSAEEKTFQLSNGKNDSNNN